MVHADGTRGVGGAIAALEEHPVIVKAVMTASPIAIRTLIAPSPSRASRAAAFRGLTLVDRAEPAGALGSGLLALSQSSRVIVIVIGG
jgi:hypothetical protein